MANANQNNPLTYMDGVSVKIAENYKPPKRIPLVMSYSQRVALNKLIQEPILSYDFSKEESIKCKIYEWQKARAAIKEQRKLRLNQLTQAMNTKSSENEVLETNDTSKEVTKDKVTSDTKDPYYQTESGILIPKILNSEQSKILTPIPLNNSNNQIAVKGCDIKGYTYKKNPINYSEFESDTSSPFDNMELKILNDLEELAQVLKYDSDDNVTSNSFGPNQPKETVSCPKTHNVSSNYSSDNIYYKLGNHMSNPGVDNSVKTKKLPPNGYYHNNYPQNTLMTQISSENSTFRSISEIMKSLEADLENKIDESKSNASSSSDVSGSLKVAREDVEDPLKELSPDVQKMALTITSMGFPLPRVARACQILEGNQKKIVEHLLAMSELLDLGFPEEKVANALLKHENDRDKALEDLLIT